MKRKGKGILQLLLLLCAPVILFIAASCSPVMYAPSSNFTPLFTNQGQGHVNAQVGGGNDVGTSVQVQGGASVAPGWMVLGGFYYGSGNSENSDNTGKGRAFEAGIGYFTALGQDEHWRFEALAAIQFGRVENNFSTYDLSNNFTKPSLQFNLGYKHKYFEVALSNKLGMVNLTNIYYTPNDTASKPWENLQNAMDEPRRFVYEPGLTLRAGIPELRFQFYLGLSPILGSDWPNDAMIVSIGLSSTFGRQKYRGMNW